MRKIGMPAMGLLLAVFLGSINVQTESQPTTQKLQTQSTQKKSPWAMDDVTHQVLDRINQERQAVHVENLHWNDKLAHAAQIHVKDMADRNYFSHESPEKTGPGERVQKVGYSWSRVGENIAEGQTDPQAVVKSWMNSPPHKANMLDKNFTETGIAYAKDKSGKMLWVEVFAKPMQ